MSTTPNAPQPAYGAPVTPPAPPLDLAPAAPRKRRRWVWPVAVAVAFLVGLAAGQGGSTESPSAAATRNPALVDATLSPEFLGMRGERDAAVKRAEAAEAAIAERDAADAAEADAAAAAEAAAEAPAGLTNGMYIVGQNITPGRYSMTSELGSLGGYVDQQDGDNYLAQEVGADDGATIIVDIANVPGSIVTFRGVTGITFLG